MKDIIARHAAAHPSMQPQDAIKLCYQATFGAEHLLADEASARAYFEREWNITAPSAGLLLEDISEHYRRVNLAAWKQTEMPREWLFRMFFLTASASNPGAEDDLHGCFRAVGEMAQEGKLPFSSEEWDRACTEYERNGGGAIHHSETYRTAEHPAYRVIDLKYTRLIPLLSHLAKRSAERSVQKQTTVIAIDGRAASGKTTIAEQLAAILGAGLVHMDDFFLPAELRTPERLAEAGGNVHYERFAEQVIPRLSCMEAFSYPKFDCSQMCLNGERTVAASPWRIVEGSYSHHPALGDYMDMRIYTHVASKEQMRRILARNGEWMAKMFAERWIPMEETYFKTFRVRERADWKIIP